MCPKICWIDISWGGGTKSPRKSVQITNGWNKPSGRVFREQAGTYFRTVFSLCVKVTGSLDGPKVPSSTKTPLRATVKMIVMMSWH